MMMKKFGWTGLLACVAVVGLMGCKPKTEEGKLQIAVIPKGTTHSFWKSVHAGAVKAQKEFGVDIIWKGPLKEDDREAQIKEVENFISRKVDGIVLAPLDDQGLVQVVHDAIDSKIPVVIIDSGLKSDRMVSFVATINYNGGVLGARRLGELLGGKGKVMMMRYAEGSASTMERERGFLETIQKEFPNIEIVSSNQYGGATTEMSRQKAENLLSLHKDVDGIFCPNESTTFGMLLALRSFNLAGKVTFVGFDSNDVLIEALKKQEIKGLVLQNPLHMGYMGVKTMVQYLRGEKVEKRIDTGCEVATPENMNDPKIAELLSPPFKKWLGEE